MRRSKKKIIGLFCLSLFLVSIGLMVIQLPRVQATTYFDCDFENATHTFVANGWTATAADSGSSSSVSSISPYAGAYAGRFIKGEDSRSVWAYKSGLSYATMYARGVFNSTQMPAHADSGYFHMLDFYHGTSNPQSSWRAIATIKYVDATHKYWALRYAYGASFTEAENVTTIQPVANVNYNVELKINSVVSGEVRMYVDGTEVASKTAVNLSGGGTANAVAIGEIYGDYQLSYIITVDEFIVSDTYNGPASGISVGNYGTTTTVAGDSCTFYSKWTSTVGNMSKYIFGTNNTGSWVNNTVAAFSQAATAWANVTKTLNSTVGLVIGWKVWANNTDNVWGSLTQSLTTTNQMSVSNVGKTSNLAGASCKFYAKWATSAGTLSKFIFGTNNTGVWVNDTATALGGTSTWSNVTKTLNSTADYIVQWRIWANNTNAVWLSIALQTFTLANPSPPKYTVWATDGTRPAIQAAVDDVVANGTDGEGTVRIPEGQWTLDNNGIGGYTDFYTLDVTPYLVFSYGGIDIIGAGMYQTNLTLKPNDATYSTMMMIVVDGSNQRPVRISGISFFGRHGSATATGDAGVFLDSTKDFRVDHCSFKWMGSVGVGVFSSVTSATSRGVVDHCEFIDIYKRAAETAGTGYGYGVGVERSYQKGSSMQSIFWNQYGTPDQFYGSYGNVTYIEDNYFAGVRHGIVAYACGAYVSRFNTFTDMHVDYGSGFNDIHGQYPDGTYGGRYMEVYNNTFYNPANDTNYPDNYPSATMFDYARAARFRGGASLVYNNVAINYSYFVNFAWDDGDTATTRPKDIYIWNNDYDHELFDIDDGTHTEGVTYFLYAKPGYVAYEYPHPLTGGYSSEAPMFYGPSMSTPDAGSTLTISMGITDMDGISKAILATNMTGSWVNNTAKEASPASTPSWNFNDTLTLPDIAGLVIYYRVYANDTNGYMSVSTVLDFETTAPLSMTSTILCYLSAYDTYIHFASTTVLSTTNRTGNYWYFNGYGFQIQNANLTITKFFVSNELGIQSTAPATVTGTTKIYLQALGSPTTVIGASSWNYAPTTKILTITVIHASTVPITIIWSMDTSAPTYSGINYNTTTVNTPCEFTVYWQDNIGLSGVIFSTNNTGTWTNNTWVDPWTGNPLNGWSPFTKTLNATVDLVVAFRWYCNDTSDNWGLTITGTLTLTTTETGYPYAHNFEYSSTMVGSSCTFTVIWQDEIGLLGAIFSWNRTGSWVNDTLQVLSGTADVASAVKTLPSAVGTSVHYRWYGKDSSNQWSATSIYSFVTTAIMPTEYTWAGSSLFQFLAEGDLLGFIQGIYVMSFGSVDIFFAFVTMLGLGAIYIRTRSLILISILWLLVGSFFIAAMPLVAGIGVLLVIFGISGLLYQLFKPHSTSY